MEEHSHLNEGLCEGVSFRGRLLLSLKTEILDNQDIGPSMVELEATVPVAEVSRLLVANETTICWSINRKHFL